MKEPDTHPGGLDRLTPAAVLVAVLLAVLVAALVACHPRLPPVSGCTPAVQSCRSDRPHICSDSQRWAAPARASAASAS